MFQLEHFKITKFRGVTRWFIEGALSRSNGLNELGCGRNVYFRGRWMPTKVDLTAWRCTCCGTCLGSRIAPAATAIASVSDCACRGSRGLLRSDVPETRRICRTESAAPRRGGDSGRRLGIGRDVPRLPQPWLRLLRRNGRQALGGCCRTTLALPANPHSLLGSKRPGASRLLEQARPYLLPRDDIGGVLLVPSDAVIELCPLRIRQ